MTDQDERAAFERWYGGDSAPSHAFIRDGEQYIFMQTQALWTAWQARAQLATEPLAWQVFDGEGFNYMSYEFNEGYRDKFIRANGEKYSHWVVPLYAAPGFKEPPKFNQEEFNEMVERGTAAWEGVKESFVDDIRGGE